MRILLLSQAISIHTIRWAKAFTDRGHEVYLVSLPNHAVAEDALPENIDLKYLSIGGGKGYYLDAYELRKYVKKIKPDIINAHYASGYGTLARKAGIHPLVLNVWGSDVYNFPNESRIKRTILKRNIKNADAVASTSICMAEELRKAIGDASLDITITPFGVDTERFRPMECEKDPGRFVFGTVKGLTYQYGIDNLIKAFSGVIKKWEAAGAKGREPHLSIYGRGSDKEAFIQLKKDLDIDKYVDIFDYIANEKVPFVLNHFDVSCFSSISESFGVSAVESMACGIPVIAADADGFKEVVADGETGLIVPRNDPNAMAEKMWELYCDEELRNRLGKNGRKRVLDLYDWEKNADILESLLIKTAQRRDLPGKNS